MSPDHSTHAFDKEKFYKVFSSNDLPLVTSELKTIQSISFSEKDAFEGALLMKKAGLVTNPKDKLSLFKSGHQKLELAIKQASSNTEYRLLRLMIQENAPGFLGYNNNLNEDKNIIVANFKTLSPIIQQTIRNYSSNSKYLRSELFQ